MMLTTMGEGSFALSARGELSSASIRAMEALSEMAGGGGSSLDRVSGKLQGEPANGL